MTRTLLIAAAAVLAVAASAGAANVLVNNNFEDPVHTKRVYMTGEYTLKASGWFRL